MIKNESSAVEFSENHVHTYIKNQWKSYIFPYSTDIFKMNFFSNNVMQRMQKVAYLNGFSKQNSFIILLCIKNSLYSFLTNTKTKCLLCRSDVYDYADDRVGTYTKRCARWLSVIWTVERSVSAALTCLIVGYSRNIYSTYKNIREEVDSEHYTRWRLPQRNERCEQSQTGGRNDSALQCIFICISVSVCSCYCRVCCVALATIHSTSTLLMTTTAATLQCCRRSQHIFNVFCVPLVNVSFGLPDYLWF